ncbi:MAG: hypothetical protein ABIR68_09630 [Ilumatobacteraceae bacterium]
MSTGRTLLIAAAMLAASIWIGSLVCLAIVSSASRTVLAGGARVALFKRIGRLYGMIGSGCLLFAIGLGIVVFWPVSSASGGGVVLLVLALALVPLTAAGMMQARRMSVDRQRHAEAPDDDNAARQVHRGARLAGALRASIGVVTLAVLVLGAHLIDRRLG